MSERSPDALRRLPLRLDQLAIDQNLGDLHGVERGALAKVVGDHPQHQAVLDRRVLADAADIGRVLAGCLVGRDIGALGGIVDDEPLAGYRRLYTEDPFGNRIELLEPLP